MVAACRTETLPTLGRRLSAFRCDACGPAAYLGVPLLCHDMLRRFSVHSYPAEALVGEESIAMFASALPTFMRSFADVPREYVTQPHLVWDMDERLHRVEFFERLLPIAASD